MPAREACPGWSYNARPSTADAGLLALQHHQNVFTNLMATGYLVFRTYAAAAAQARA